MTGGRIRNSNFRESPTNVELRIQWQPLASSFLCPPKMATLQRSCCAEVPRLMTRNQVTRYRLKIQHLPSALASCLPTKELLQGGRLNRCPRRVTWQMQSCFQLARS